MPGIAVVTDLLRRLPAGVRRALYVVVSLAGAALAVFQLLGRDQLGPLSLEQALQAYALISPAVGVVAVANVSPPETFEDLGPGFDADFDLASFEPGGFGDAVEGGFTG